MSSPTPTNPEDLPPPGPNAPGLPTALGLGLVHGAAMLAVGLTAKLLLAWERHGVDLWISHKPPLVYAHRDIAVAGAWTILVALGLAAAARAGRFPLGRRIAHGALLLAAGYVALNVAFFRMFSTPLNRGLIAMSGAAGDMVDSALDFVTGENLLALGLCLGLALALPPLLERIRASTRALAAVAIPLALALSALASWGAAIGRTTDARGLDRNALWELARLPFPEHAAPTVDREAQRRQAATPLPVGSILEPGARDADLSALRGAAAGMNVMLVVMESTGAQYLGPWGADPDPTPNLSRLAEHALVFDAWYATTPTSMKAMFSYLCGTYPYPRPSAESEIAPQLPCQSMPEVFTAAGHRAAVIHSGRFSYRSKLRFLEGRGYERLVDFDRMQVPPTAYSNRWGVEESVALREIEDFLGDLGPDERFFVTYLPIFPHHPYVVPDGVTPRMGAGSALERYLSAVAYADDVTGELIALLREAGRLENTLLVFLGDHGEAFNQHPGVAIHSTAVYEENVHVPALIYNERLFPAPIRLPGPHDHTDLAPTVADLLGLPIPERWQGQSALAGERDMARFFADYSFLLLGLRDGPYKYIREVPTGHEELYDLTADPTEQRDLAAAHPELLARYREHTDHWFHRQLAIFADYDAYVAGAAPSATWTLIEDLEPVLEQHGPRKLQARQSAGRRPLRVAGTTYATGIGVHANSLYRYELGGGFTRVEGLVGRDQGAQAGEVAGEIWVDGARRFASGPLRRDTPAVRFELDLRGARTLELRAQDSDGRTAGDHLNWVEVRLE